jgi:hypothetical protein
MPGGTIVDYVSSLGPSLVIDDIVELVSKLPQPFYLQIMKACMADSPNNIWHCILTQREYRSRRYQRGMFIRISKQQLF